MTITRRRLLETAVSVLAAAALPAPAPHRRWRSASVDEKSGGISPVMTTLSEYISGAAGRALPAGSRRTHQISHPRHDCGDGFRRDLPPGQVAAFAFARTCRRENRDRRRHRRCCAGRSKPRSSTACWRTPTRPTTRMRRRSRIPAAPSCRRRWPSASSSASTGRVAARGDRSATTSARASR